MKTKLVIAVLACLVIVLSSCILIEHVFPLLLYRHRDPQVKANLFILIERANGKETIEAGNVLTNDFENCARDAFGFGNASISTNQTKWISLSNDAAPAATWTKLTNEVAANGFSRALGTVTAWLNGTDYAYNVTKTFTATGAQQLQCAGLNWNDTPQSDNNLAACASFTQTTFQATAGAPDNATFIWVITFDFN